MSLSCPRTITTYWMGAVNLIEEARTLDQNMRMKGLTTGLGRSRWQNRMCRYTVDKNELPGEFKLSSHVGISKRNISPASKLCYPFEPLVASDVIRVPINSSTNSKNDANLL